MSSSQKNSPVISVGVTFVFPHIHCQFHWDAVLTSLNSRVHNYQLVHEYRLSHVILSTNAETFKLFLHLF